MTPASALIENQRIEFKRELSTSLEKEVVAFLNAKEGGVIYIGVDDETQETVALDDIDDLQLKIKDRIKNNISPSTMGLFDVLVDDWQGEAVIKIVIASGAEKPYYLRALMKMSSLKAILCHKIKS